MSLTEKEVRHVARLSAIELKDEEVPKYQTELGDILQYVERLSQLQTRGVVPTSHVHGVVNFFRDDIIRDSIAAEELERFAPDFKNGFFRVPKIIG